MLVYEPKITTGQILELVMLLGVGFGLYAKLVRLDFKVSLMWNTWRREHKLDRNGNADES